MKPLTEAQLMGFRGAMVPPTRRKYHVDAAPSAEQARMARNKASADASTLVETIEDTIGSKVVGS